MSPVPSPIKLSKSRSSGSKLSSYSSRTPSRIKGSPPPSPSVPSTDLPPYQPGHSTPPAPPSPPIPSSSTSALPIIPPSSPSQPEHYPITYAHPVPHPDEIRMPQPGQHVHGYYVITRGRECGIFFNWYVIHVAASANTNCIAGTTLKSVLRDAPNPVSKNTGHGLTHMLSIQLPGTITISSHPLNPTAGFGHAQFVLGKMMQTVRPCRRTHCGLKCSGQKMKRRGQSYDLCSSWLVPTSKCNLLVSTCVVLSLQTHSSYFKI